MKDKQCIMCGMDMKKFVKTGKLGCPNCYNEFKETIDFLIDKMQNPENQETNNDHQTRTNRTTPVIEPTGKNTESNMRLRKLRRELKKKLKEEAYEEAAQIRDEIEELESESN